MAHVREQPQQTIRIRNFCGELAIRASDGDLRVARLSTVNPLFFIQSRENSASLSVAMEAELDQSRIEGVEELRRGGNLEWIVTIHAHIDGASGPQAVSGTDRVEMSRSSWIDILGQLGYRDSISIEIVLRTTRSKNVAKSLKYLRAAHSSFMLGNDRQAIAECRDALEALDPLLGDDRNVSFENSRSHTKQTRLLVLRKALKLLPHAAKHAEKDENPIEWERSDAELILAMTAAFIRRSMPA